MNRQLEDIPPIIRHVGFIVLVVLFSVTGHWMMGHNWPCSRNPASKPVAHASQRPAPGNGAAVAGTVEKGRPTPNPLSLVQPEAAPSSVSQPSAL